MYKRVVMSISISALVMFVARTGIAFLVPQLASQNQFQAALYLGTLTLGLLLMWSHIKAFSEDLGSDWALATVLPTTLSMTQLFIASLINFGINIVGESRNPFVEILFVSPLNIFADPAWISISLIVMVVAFLPYVRFKAPTDRLTFMDGQLLREGQVKYFWWETPKIETWGKQLKWNFNFSSEPDESFTLATDIDGLRARLPFTAVLDLSNVDPMIYVQSVNPEEMLKNLKVMARQVSCEIMQGYSFKELLKKTSPDELVSHDGPHAGGLSFKTTVEPRWQTFVSTFFAF